MSERLGIGVVGVNPRIRRTILGGLAGSKRARLAAVVSRDAEKAARTASEFDCAAYTSLAAMLADRSVHVVFVCTPHHLHRPMSLEALAAGTRVICEKPLALSVAEAEDMANAARRTGLATEVNFTYHSLGGHCFVERLLREGAIGRLNHLSLTYWQARQGLPGAKPADALLDVGSHLLDLVCWWAEAGGAGEVNSIVSQEGGRVGAEDRPILTALARTTGGALVSVQANRAAAGWRNGMECVLAGEKGSLALSFDTDAATVRGARFGDSRPEGAFQEMGLPPELQVSYADFPAYHIDRLAAGLQGDLDFPDFAYGLRVQRLLDAARTSIRERRWVDVVAGRNDNADRFD
ncbi:MAG: Gfo/Idh/MocA family protein [Chloroflexota bacterium]